ncbi:Uncharacterised protein [Niallia circulans]|nr:Uncharacterised protein [Niallia circulans]
MENVIGEIIRKAKDLLMQTNKGDFKFPGEGACRSVMEGSEGISYIFK